MLSVAIYLAAVDPSDQAQQNLDRCIYTTSNAWTAPKVDAGLTVEAAIVHCRPQVDAYVEAVKAAFKVDGMDATSAERAASGLVASTVRIARSFATDIVRKKQLGAQ